MTDRFWPILGLDEGATERDVRRAYAKRLREQGFETGIAAFQALRAEFEAALAAARSEPAARAAPTRMGSFPLRRIAIESAPLVEPNDAPPEAGSSTPAVEEIRALLRDGELQRAGDRLDLALASNEIDLQTESELELELAHSWLANTTLDAAALNAIVRARRWDDVLSGFSLAPEIVARLQAESPPARRPGERFVGQFNWGAFCLAPFWLMAHGLKGRGYRLLLLGTILFVIPLGQLALLWIAFGYGRKGNAIAVKHRRFVDDEQFVAVQTAWRNWGLGLCTMLSVSLSLAAALAANR